MSKLTVERLSADFLGPLPSGEYWLIMTNRAGFRNGYLVAIVGGGKSLPYILRGPEPTAVDAVSCKWRYTLGLLVVQARNDADDV